VNPALHQQLHTAQLELHDLAAAVHHSPARAELAAAIARRDAVLWSRAAGVSVDVAALAALEADTTAPVEGTPAVAGSPTGAMAMRYLDALEIGRSDPDAHLPGVELLHRMLSRLIARDRDDDGLATGRHATLASVASERLLASVPGAGIVRAATTYRRLAPPGQTVVELTALARLASALILRPVDARPDDMALAPQLDYPAMEMDERGMVAEATGGDEPDRWLASFARSVSATVQRTRELVARLSALEDADRVRIDALGKAAPSSHRVHRALQRWPIASIARMMDATGLQVQAATSALHRLRGLGIIREITHRHRHRLYSYDGYVDIIAADVDSWDGT